MLPLEQFISGFDPDIFQTVRTKPILSDNATIIDNYFILEINLVTDI